ncbi:hypothetical protein EV210_102348 [Anaerospora hongkongensis]|uniref:Transposase n=1 Tax=Anaerospora hongkongensis TaxID=244830 RepID=A0A4R1QB68_9FIRM|nr:DUF6262 family protein [Anaerospora hongkongensis]TCL39432.1 hypothetical protein EV210_102348 [Anaerospora hongkongensis]
MSKRGKNTTGLTIHQNETHAQHLTDVDDAISTLKKNKKQISVLAIAKFAGLSRQTIYNNQDLHEKVLGAMLIQKSASKQTTDPKKVERANQKDAKIKELRLKIVELNAKLESSAAQLIRLEDLESETNRLRVVETKLRDENAELQRELIKLRSK